MSVSQHPIALRLERQVGGATKLLATVMALPLIDGIFPALVLAGVLDTTFGIIETGLLIFGGSATMAVILAEMDGTRRQQAMSILLIGALIIPVAAVQAALAPTLEGMLNLDIFKRFAGLVIITIAAKTASSKIGELLPSPGVIIVLGFVASYQPGGATLVFISDPSIVVRGAAAAGVGVAFALSVALLSPQLRGRVDIDRFRFGSAVALGVLALPILLAPFDVMQTEAPIALAVLAVTGLFAYDPDAEGIGSEKRSDDPDDPDGEESDAAASRDDAEEPAPEERPESDDRLPGVEPDSGSALVDPGAVDSNGDSPAGPAPTAASGSAASGSAPVDAASAADGGLEDDAESGDAEDERAKDDREDAPDAAQLADDDDGPSPAEESEDGGESRAPWL